MLTADLVRVRRAGAELRLAPLDARSRERALELCGALHEAALALVGASRDEVDEAFDTIEAAPRDRRLLEALRKLVEDRCVFDTDEGLDPEELRRELFSRASAARHEGRAFDAEARAGLLAALAGERTLEPAALEQALYADLRGAQRLRLVKPLSPRALVEDFDVAQAQAVLLRAVRVTCDLRCGDAATCRALFRRLKFLRLLYRIERVPAGERGGFTHRVHLDGPYSLFESATRYGLQLALALPALLECDALRLEADVRWGKERQALTFRFEAGAPTAREATEEGETAAPPARLPDEVAALQAAIAEVGGPWRAVVSTRILDLPGVGLCVPDLELRREGQRPVYLEVLGYWSRDAVWRRVELVERGLGERILFAVSHHLRVSEQALGDEVPGALYVYKRVMSARAVLERAERIAAR